MDQQMAKMQMTAGGKETAERFLERRQLETYKY